jgi:hypothetical protein
MGGVAEDDSFLARWARRKQAQKADKPAAAEIAKPSDMPADKASEKPSAAADEGETIDLTSLPPIESLGADSDYTVFLRPGVPDATRLAALRQLWLTEPSIRNYEALVDYAWDFNAPGYGKLLPTDDVEKLLKAVFRDQEKPCGPEGKEVQATAAANVSEPPKIAPQHDSVRRSDNRAAISPQPPEASAPLLPKSEAKADVDTANPGAVRKRHGAALPRTPPTEGEG